MTNTTLTLLILALLGSHHVAHAETYTFIPIDVATTVGVSPVRSTVGIGINRADQNKLWSDISYQNISINATIVLMSETDVKQFHRGQGAKCNLAISPGGAKPLVRCAIFSEDPATPYLHNPTHDGVCATRIEP